MTKNFKDEWSKLSPQMQDTVKKKTQEKISNGYEPNRIKDHINNNFTTGNNTSNVSKSASNNNAEFNSNINTDASKNLNNSNPNVNSFGGGVLNNNARTTNNYNNSNIIRMPKYNTNPNNANTNVMGNNNAPIGIPGVNVPKSNKINNLGSPGVYNEQNKISSIEKTVRTKDNNSNSSWSKIDDLMLKNILSYNNPGKTREEQNKTIKERADRTNRINELQKQEYGEKKNSGIGTWSDKKIVSNDINFGVNDVNTDSQEQNNDVSSKSNSRSLGYKDFIKSPQKEGELPNIDKLMNTPTSDIKSLYNNGSLNREEATDLLNVMVNQIADTLRDYNPNVDDNDLNKIKSYLSSEWYNMTPNEAIYYMGIEGKFEKTPKNTFGIIFNSERGFDDSQLDKYDFSKSQKEVMKDAIKNGIGGNFGECAEFARKFVGYDYGTQSLLGENAKDRPGKFRENEPVIGGLVYFDGNGYSNDYGHISVITGYDREKNTIEVIESNMDRHGTIGTRTINLDDYYNYNDSNATNSNANNRIGFFNNTPLANAVHKWN